MSLRLEGPSADAEVDEVGEGAPAKISRSSCRLGWGLVCVDSGVGGAGGSRKIGRRVGIVGVLGL